MISNQDSGLPSGTAAADQGGLQNPQHIPGPQPWSEDFVFSIITSYLSNSLSPQEAALALTTPVNEFLSSQAEETDDSPSEFDIWSAMLATARQHPYNSPTIPALVTLLAAIKEAPTPMTLKRNRYTYWTDLPHFGWEARENWNRTIREPEDKGGWTCTVEQWTSMNAFVAQITVAGVIDFKNYCIWAMNDALEDIPGRRSVPGPITKLDRHVPAAAVWILVAGKMLYTEWLGLGVEGERTPQGLGSERWRFWKERFGWVARQDEVEIKDETRGFARTAAERMEEIERVEVPRRWIDPETVKVRPS
ncbi:MAG: hypothetical protein Q9225_006563 [Loekoesia sp. 1 TL-2023]